MTSNRSIKTEKLNDQYILLKEFLPVNNSEKAKWPVYFVKWIYAAQ